MVYHLFPESSATSTPNHLNYFPKNNAMNFNIPDDESTISSTFSTKSCGMLSRTAIGGFPSDVAGIRSLLRCVKDDTVRNKIVELVAELPSDFCNILFFLVDKCENEGKLSAIDYIKTELYPSLSNSCKEGSDYYSASSVILLKVLQLIWPEICESVKNNNFKGYTNSNNLFPYKGMKPDSSKNSLNERRPSKISYSSETIAKPISLNSSANSGFIPHAEYGSGHKNSINTNSSVSNPSLNVSPILDTSSNLGPNFNNGLSFVQPNVRIKMGATPNSLNHAKLSSLINKLSKISLPDGTIQSSQLDEAEKETMISIIYDHIKKLFQKIQKFEIILTNLVSHNTITIPVSDFIDDNFISMIQSKNTPNSTKISEDPIHSPKVAPPPGFDCLRKLSNNELQNINVTMFSDDGSNCESVLNKNTNESLDYALTLAMQMGQEDFNNNNFETAGEDSASEQSDDSESPLSEAVYQRSDHRSKTTPANSFQASVMRELAGFLMNQSQDDLDAIGINPNVDNSFYEDNRKKAVRFSEFSNESLQNGDVEKSPPTTSTYQRSNQRSCSLPKAPGDLQIESNGIQLVLHLHGRCKPCAFYYNKKKGCRNGTMCEFCHHEDHAKLTLKQWKKQQQKLYRAVRSLKSADSLDDCSHTSGSSNTIINQSGLTQKLQNVAAFMAENTSGDIFNLIGNCPQPFSEDELSPHPSPPQQGGSNFKGMNYTDNMCNSAIENENNSQVSMNCDYSISKNSKFNYMPHSNNSPTQLSRSMTAPQLLSSIRDNQMENLHDVYKTIGKELQMHLASIMNE